MKTGSRGSRGRPGDDWLVRPLCRSSPARHGAAAGAAVRLGAAYVPERVFDTPQRRVHRLRGHACRPGAGRRRPRRRAARRSEYAPARGRAAAGPARAARSPSPCRSRCSSATSSRRSMPTSPAACGGGVPEGARPVAALRHRLSGAGRDSRRAQRWPVVAANVPRRIAADVAKTGLAASTRCRQRPAACSRAICSARGTPTSSASPSTMGDHPGSARRRRDRGRRTRPRSATTRRSASRTRRWPSRSPRRSTPHGRSPGAVVHFTGAFHSDFGAGTAERVRRRLDGRRVAVVSMMPVENLDTLAPGDDDSSAPTTWSTRSSSGAG